MSSPSKSPFAAPATAAGIDLTELNGALLLITVASVETGIQTVHGPAEAIRCGVAVLDGPQAGTEHRDTLLFPKVLCAQLRPNVGAKVLARLGQGLAKPGQSPPWMLSEATPADTEVGLAWLAKNTPAVVGPAPPF